MPKISKENFAHFKKKNLKFFFTSKKYIYTFFKKIDIVVDLVGGGSVINGAYSVWLSFDNGTKFIKRFFFK